MDEAVVARLLIAEQEAHMSRIAAMEVELAGIVAASANSNIDDEHDPEGATIAFEREQLAATRALAVRHLADVRAALERLTAGQYGVCEACGGAIGESRLTALPAARLCIDCAGRR